MIYKISDHLYLSNYEEAKKVPLDFFVINCTKDLPMIPTDGGGTRLLVDDDPSSEDTMTKNLPLMVLYIDDHIKKNKNVLVHCYAGQQRSAAVISAYLIDKKGMSVDEAITYIKSKKPDAFYDGVHFYDSLLRFEKIRNSL